MTEKKKRRSSAEVQHAKAEEARQKNREIAEAIDRTLQQIPIEPPAVNWNESNLDHAQGIIDLIDADLRRGKTPRPRKIAVHLFEIDGGALGVYTIDCIREIVKQGTVKAAVREHPHGRNKSSEAIVAWRISNPNAPIEECCKFIEPYTQYTYSTKDENNKKLKPIQNKESFGAHLHWHDIYDIANVPWIYVHTPPGNRSLEYFEYLLRYLDSVDL